MNHLKDYVRAAHPGVNNFLTYADNYAVGYFKKQVCSCIQVQVIPAQTDDIDHLGLHEGSKPGSSALGGVYQGL